VAARNWSRKPGQPYRVEGSTPSPSSNASNESFQWTNVLRFCASAPDVASQAEPTTSAHPATAIANASGGCDDRPCAESCRVSARPQFMYCRRPKDIAGYSSRPLACDCSRLLACRCKRKTWRHERLVSGSRTRQPNTHGTSATAARSSCARRQPLRSSRSATGS
jgi:hypothetical protein